METQITMKIRVNPRPSDIVWKFLWCEDCKAWEKDYQHKDLLVEPLLAKTPCLDLNCNALPKGLVTVCLYCRPLEFFTLG